MAGETKVEFRSVTKGTVPLQELFAPWELVDWAGIAKAIADGKSVRIETAVKRDAEYWRNYALNELGRQNVGVVHLQDRLPEIGGLWIIPRGDLAGVKVDDYDWAPE